MLKNNRRLLFISALFFIGASSSQAASINVCYDQWAPMTMFPTATSPDRGVVIDMVDHIYTAQGYQLNYFEVPLARGLDMVAEGLCDMLPEYLYSSAEHDFVYAEEPTFAYSTAFVVRKETAWQYQGIESIQGKRVATGQGWDYSSMSVEYQAYLDAPENASFVEVIAGYDDVVDRIFHMIKNNRVDLYVDNDLVLQHVLNRLNLSDDLKIVGPGLKQKLIERPIFSNQMPADKRQTLINIWNAGRVSFKGTQEKALLQKYNISLSDID